VAEAILDKALRRPWHGACDRAAHPDVAALRLHRAEVAALLAYRCIPLRAQEQAQAWRDLTALRESRRALMPCAAAQRLPPLPHPPAGAASAWRNLLRRLGLRPA
jgi:hypothetical protein